MATQRNDCNPSDNFAKAMNDVRVGGLSIRRAAKKWGLKRTTLQDRLSGLVENGRRRGPPPFLTNHEESQFVDWLIELANRGFGVSKDSLLGAVKTFIDKDGRVTPFKDNKPGNKWFRSFVKRNLQVKLRKARPLEKKRAKISKEDVDAWFHRFEAFLVEKNLANKPSQIWNCDETGFDMQGRPGNIIGPSDRKQAPYRILPGSREHVTVLPCFNACGQWMPPYFLFPGKRIPATYNPLEGGIEGSVFSMTDSGYMDTQTFYMWFANHFVPNLPPARPVVLLIDGHDSHLNLELFQLAEKNGIYLYSLLQNATHLVQPADVGLFGPMKKSWYKEVRNFAQRNPNTDITKKNFCAVFKASWEEVMSPSILVNAFRKSGIYPLDRKQISNEQLVCTMPSSSESAPPPVSTCYSRSSRGAVQAFEALEAALTTPSKRKYRRRITENYNLEGSPTFSAWQKLYCSIQEPSASGEVQNNGEPTATAASSTNVTPTTPLPPSTSTAANPARSACPITVASSASVVSSTSVTHSASVTPSTGVAPSVPPVSTSVTPPSTSAVGVQHIVGAESSLCQIHSSATVLREILTYPTLEVNGPAKRKNAKRRIPNFVSGPESMKILLDEKLKKARQLAEKQKKLQEREKKKEERHKKLEEEKLRKEQRKKEIADRKKKDQEKPVNKRKRKSTKSQSRGNRGKTWRESVANLNDGQDDVCNICLQEYLPTDDENNPWVLCDGCQSWMHIDCVPFGVDIATINRNESFFCHACSL